MRAIIAIVAAAGLVSACGLGGSRLNPFNWFGGEREVRVAAPVAEAGPRIPLVDQVVSLKAERAPGGAIVSAVGLPPTQGFWEAELAPVSNEGGVYLLEFRLLPPVTPQRVGTQPSREVLAGTFLSDQTLAGVRTIAVQAARNRRSVSR